MEESMFEVAKAIRELKSTLAVSLLGVTICLFSITISLTAILRRMR